VAIDVLLIRSKLSTLLSPSKLLSILSGFCRLSKSRDRETSKHKRRTRARGSQSKGESSSKTRQPSLDRWGEERSQTEGLQEQIRTEISGN